MSEQDPPMPTAEQIVAGLTPGQRELVIRGPVRWTEADTLPEGLFDYDEAFDSESGEEARCWEPTALGRAVQDLLGTLDEELRSAGVTMAAGPCLQGLAPSISGLLGV